MPMHWYKKTLYPTTFHKQLRSPGCIGGWLILNSPSNSLIANASRDPHTSNSILRCACTLYFSNFFIFVWKWFVFWIEIIVSLNHNIQCWIYCVQSGMILRFIEPWICWFRDFDVYIPYLGGSEELLVYVEQRNSLGSIFMQ